MALSLETIPPGSSVYDGLGEIGRFGIHKKLRRVVSRAVSTVTAIPTSIVQEAERLTARVATNVSTIAEQVASEITRVPSNVADLVERAGEELEEIGEKLEEIGKQIIGAEGLTLREIADALDLPGTIDFMIAGIDPWKVKAALYADQLETIPLAELRATAPSEVTTLLNTLGLELVTPPRLPGAVGIIQSPMGQVVIKGISFAGPKGKLAAAAIQLIGSIGSSFGRRKTEKKQKQLEVRLNAINAEAQKQLNRAVQMLGFLGDPDALEVLGVVPELKPTIEGETAPVKFSTVLPLVAAAGAGLLAITALSGPRTRPGVLGRASVGLGALDAADNLGLPELTALSDAVNRLQDENDRLVALLLEVSIAPVPAAVPQVPSEELPTPSLKGIAGIAPFRPSRFVAPAVLIVSALFAFAGAFASQTN